MQESYKKESMLEYLRIKNFGLLESVEMEFDTGLNVITGESGSGKSFIIKAILFLLAHKFPSSIVRNGAEYASVEALFIHKNEEVIIRRELSASSGRSRFFINDVLSSQETIKGIREELILYTSQHAQHKLLQPAFHTGLLDSFLDNGELLIKRDTILQELRICRKKQEELEKKYIALAERRELLEFQQSEIARVNPSVEEEEMLEQQREEYRRVQSSIDAIHEAQTLIAGGDDTSLYDRLYSLVRILEKVSSSHAEYVEVVESLQVILEQLKGIESSIMKPLFSIPSVDIESIEGRLFELAKLKRSLHRSIEEICLFEHEISENLSFLDSCELEMKYLKKEEEKYKEELQEVIATLAVRRYDGASILAKKIEGALLPLGFSKGCTVVFSFTPQEIWEDCFEDKAHIEFCPNVGHTAMPLESIASGGELSRFLLAISSIISHSSSQSLLFDEVDTGVGGATLKKVAEQLYALSQERQLIVITHWSVVAQYAKNHFLVEKEVHNNMTTTTVTSLPKEAREQELIRMKGE